MATYRIRRKLFNDVYVTQNQKSGMGTGAKILAGGLATTGALAGGALAAKKGLLGAGIQKKTNKALLGIGTRMAKNGNETIAKWGNKAINSGVKGYGQAARTTAYNKAIGKGLTQAAANEKALASRNLAESAAKKMAGVK